MTSSISGSRHSVYTSRTCPGCEAGEMEVFHRVHAVPTNSCILLASRREALHCQRGDIHLGFCPRCGFVSNLAFEPELTEYSDRYEETQGFSETFNTFHRTLAQRLIGQYNLRGKDIIEIGCGKGEFLMLLCDLGNNQGLGFDPGFRADRVDASAHKPVRFIQDFYSEVYASYEADFICCKMTLEHIHQTARFVGTIRRAIGNRSDTIVFFQIPDMTRILKDCAFEDIYYEHCSYFSPGSLSRLFRRCDFSVLQVGTEYDDQYLTIEAKPGGHGDIEAGLPPVAHDLEDLKRHIRDFPSRFEHRHRLWQQQLDDYAREHKKVVLWGSGSKAVSFLTTLNIASGIAYVVDINPNRVGHFMPGTAQRIVAPEFLREYAPDVVIIMNRVYRREIQAELARMNLHPEVIAL